MENAKTKRVLIALDYDPMAQKVAEQGYLLATAMNAESYLLHVISDPIYYTSPEYSPILGFNGFMDIVPPLSENSELLRNASQHFLNQFKIQLGDEHIQTIISEGDYAEAILEVSDNIKANLIVMGSHGRKWLERILLGSVTERVLERTTIPVCIIPTKKST